MKKLWKIIKKLFKIDYKKYFDGLGLDFDFSNKQRINYTQTTNSDNMATITINGKSFTTKGNNISVINDKIMVNGVVIESGLSGIVKIQFEGDVANLDANVAEITGNVIGKVDSNTLKVTGDIRGNVDSNTVHCRDIYGSVEANVVNGNIKM